MNSYRAIQAKAVEAGFNPHSPLLANELAVRAGLAVAADCFNPHSPLLANEFAQHVETRRLQIVSIHIRHCWRMNWRVFFARKGAFLFQSTFAIAGE